MLRNEHKPKFSKRHYAFLVNAIRDSNSLKEFSYILSIRLKADNYKFNKEMFLKAIYGEVDLK